MPNILCPQRIPCCKFNKFSPRPSIISGTPPDPCLGVDYSFVFEAVGGTAPYTWSVALGNLPDGLTLTETGLLSGTPELNGIFIFTIKLEDAACEVRGVSYTLEVTVCETVETAVVWGDEELQTAWGDPEGNAWGEIIP